MLSGGQQALATLSLSFALQAAFPSPFYFFDEIDSALDSAAVSRVADYLHRQQHTAQYLVVSHKPQVRLKLAYAKSEQMCAATVATHFCLGCPSSISI